MTCFPSALQGVRHWWHLHGDKLLWGAVLLMLLAAIHRLGNEFSRLLYETGPAGAIDLKLRHSEVHRWFSGEPIHDPHESSPYPPASMILLWPLLGWLPVDKARWWWATTTIMALGWFVVLSLRESGADRLVERAFIALLPLSIYGTSAAIGNGQISVHLLPVLVASLVSLATARRWYEDLCGAGLFLVTLVKPSVAVPFTWLIWLLPSRLRSLSAVLAGYALLTWLATSFQQTGLRTLLSGWMTRAGGVLSRGAWGYGNVSNWLVGLGLPDWIPYAGFLILMTLGGWLFHHRRADPWVLIGITAIVARLWTYHQLYDDVLILLPMIALFRIAKLDASHRNADVTAGSLLALTWLGMLAPARLLSFPVTAGLFSAGQAIIWLAVLVFFVAYARNTDHTRVSA